MDSKTKDELILLTSIKSHSLWCDNEIKSFYDRLINTSDKDSVIMRFNKACYKDNNKRNEIIINDNNILNKCFNDYDYFKDLIDKKNIIIKRYVKRDISIEDIKILGNDYIDGMENILKDFNELSSVSKMEAMDGAISSIKVYEDLRFANISIDNMNDDKIKDIIGIAIHNDWLKRNIDHASDNLKASYLELDEWNKLQDLNIFYIMLDIIKDNPSRYYIESKNMELPNYMEEEKEILKNMN